MRRAARSGRGSAAPGTLAQGPDPPPGGGDEQPAHRAARVRALRGPPLPRGARVRRGRVDGADPGPAAGALLRPARRTLSHAELWARVEAPAAGLRAADLVAEGSFAGICGFASVDWVVAD